MVKIEWLKNSQLCFLKTEVWAVSYLFSFLFMLFYNFPQTDWVSVRNHFLNREINVNWCKQRGSLLTHVSTNLNDGASYCFLSTSLILLIVFHSCTMEGSMVIRKCTQWRPVVVCDGISLQNKQTNNNKRKQSQKIGRKTW